jgi:hypothetical protein
MAPAISKLALSRNMCLAINRARRSLANFGL